MRQSILATKLFVPTPRPERIFREHLIQQLNDCIDQKLTLVSAPAGFGKTTLVSEWILNLRSQKNPASIAWISLDEGDNDPVRFLTYLISALRTVNADLAKGAIGALQSPQAPPIENTLAYLINESISIRERVVLVLDDYHLIDSQHVDQILEFLLENLPPGIHLVLSTREDPALSLSRLRVSGEMNEIRASDLRFTMVESTNFLNHLQGLDLSSAEITALDSRTEGWIAGLQLAAISLQGKDNPSQSIKKFSGSNRLVLDYLMDEVLDRQPEDIHNFLLQTSILDRLSGELCNSVTGQEQSYQILERLDKANLFLVPLDDERRWYRYHHLFADLLLQRLKKIRPEQVHSLHQLASNWYEENGLIDEAIEHLLLIKDYAQAVPLIGIQNEQAWKGGDLTRLYQWIRLLPDDILAANPGLCIVRAWDMGRSGQVEAAKKCLQTAEKGLDSSIDLSNKNVIDLSEDDKKVIKAVAATIRSFLAFYEGDLAKIEIYAQEALNSLPEKETIWRVNALIALGDAYSMSGEIAKSAELRREAWEESKRSGNTFMNLVASMKLAINLRQLGKIDRVLEICQEQDAWAQEIGLTHTPEYGWLQAIWGEMLAEVNSLDEALERTSLGAQISKGGDIVIVSWINLDQIIVRYSRGDYTGAESILQLQDNLSLRGNLPHWLTSLINPWRVRLWLVTGNSQTALDWLEKKGITAANPPADIHNMELFALCRALIAAGRPQESIPLLDQILAATRERGHISKTLEVLLVSAQAHEGCGNHDQAIIFMKEALSLASDHGFFRTVINEGPAMARLLYTAVENNIHPEFASELIAAFPINDQQKPSALDDGKKSSPLVEPLSDREIEVLELLAQGHTNQQIAEILFLSLNTVKSHARSIYVKLDVNNRTQAVAKARSLGLIKST